MYNVRQSTLSLSYKGLFSAILIQWDHGCTYMHSAIDQKIVRWQMTLASFFLSHSSVCSPRKQQQILQCKEQHHSQCCSLLNVGVLYYLLLLFIWCNIWFEKGKQNSALCRWEIQTEEACEFAKVVTMVYEPETTLRTPVSAFVFIWILSTWQLSCKSVPVVIGK